MNEGVWCNEHEGLRTQTKDTLDADDIFALMPKDILEKGGGWVEFRQPCHQEAGLKVVFLQDSRAVTLICPECKKEVVKIKVELKN